MCVCVYYIRQFHFFSSVSLETINIIIITLCQVMQDGNKQLITFSSSVSFKCKLLMLKITIKELLSTIVILFKMNALFVSSLLVLLGSGKGMLSGHPSGLGPFQMFFPF